MDTTSPGLPSATERPVPASPSQPVDDNAAVAREVVHNLFAASGKTAVSGNPGWPPASSGATAPPGTEYIPTVKLPSKRQAPGHLLNKAARPSQIPGWTRSHVFSNDDIATGLQKLFVTVEEHADILDNLAVEAGCLNSSINTGSNDAYSNTRLLVNQVRDDRHLWE